MPDEQPVMRIVRLSLNCHLQAGAAQ
jgi:hypothetical protein